MDISQILALKEEIKQKTSEQLQKWRWRESVPEEYRIFGGKTLSEGAWKPGASGRNGPLTEKGRKVSARPATQCREMAAKGEKGSTESQHIIYSIVTQHQFLAT